MIPDLEPLESLEGYRQYFMDETLWRSHIQTVCLRHNLLPCQQIRAGLAGTCPTFIVEDRWVVKFFGRLFDGQRSYETELQVSRLLPSDLTIRVPAILHFGNLFEADSVWSWPYLIFEYINGISIGEVYEQVSLEDKLSLARTLGEATRQLQHLPLERAPLFHAGWDGNIRFLQNQRKHCLANHREWQSVPVHLIDQLEAYLLPVENLVDRRVPPGLIHADITRDHILGQLQEGRWETLGLIDFGDARVGNVFYDLAALHLDLFRYDKRLLRAYLEVFGFRDDPQFTQKAMSAALLHQFNVFGKLSEVLPHVCQAVTLDDLANMIWDIELM